MNPMRPEPNLGEIWRNDYGGTWIVTSADDRIRMRPLDAGTWRPKRGFITFNHDSAVWVKIANNYREYIEMIAYPASLGAVEKLKQEIISRFEKLKNKGFPCE